MSEQKIVQHRRDIYSNFAPSKIKPGEIIMITSGDPNSSSGKAVYACVVAGIVLQLATLDELNTYDQAAQTAASTATQAKTDIINLKDQIDNELTSAQSAAQNAVTAANTATQANNQISEQTALAQTAAENAQSILESVQAETEAFKSDISEDLGKIQTASQSAADAAETATQANNQISEQTALAQTAAENAQAALDAIQGQADTIKNQIDEKLTSAQNAAQSAEEAADHAQDTLSAVQTKAAEIEDILVNNAHTIETGGASTDANGSMYIYLSDNFKEALGTDGTYRVFLQEEGEGKVYVSEMTDTFFVVSGTEKLAFSWLVII